MKKALFLLAFSLALSACLFASVNAAPSSGPPELITMPAYSAPAQMPQAGITKQVLLEPDAIVAMTRLEAPSPDYTNIATAATLAGLRCAAYSNTMTASSKARLWPAIRAQTQSSLA